MYKLRFVFILILISIACADRKRNRRDNVMKKSAEKWAYNPHDCSNTLIDVRLRNFTSLDFGNETTENPRGKNVVEVLIPSAPGSLFLCYPETKEEQRGAYLFSHIACRQLGYTSFISFHNRELSSAVESGKTLYGLRPSTYSCTGQEQNVSYCQWNEVTIADCTSLSEISCGECRATVKGTSGIIKSPGYPLVYLYDVTCEWDIIVPEDHSILLSAMNFETLLAKSKRTFCHRNKPYIEIIYGIQNKITMERYCNMKDMKNLSIPHREVRIRIFTGLFLRDNKFLTEDQGVAISFKAQANNGKANLTRIWKAVFVCLFILIFIAIGAMCHCWKKYKLSDARRRQGQLPIINMPTEQDLNMAYEFQRCRIQAPQKTKPGLRLRSNGSGEKLKGFLYPSQPGSSFLSASNLPTYVSQDPLKGPKQPVSVETPKTIIPNIVLSNEMGDDEKLDPIERVKTKLVGRFSNTSDRGSDVSITLSTSSPVFFPSAVQSFQIYRSVSSESDDKPPPYEIVL